jgi:hypothetical protein
MININKMKKVKLLLVLMMCYGMVNAQLDSSVNKTNPLKADTIIISSDSVFIGKTISADTITIGNILIIKNQRDQDNNKIKKETFFSTNKDSVQVGPVLIVTDKKAKKPDFKTIIKIGDASYGRPIDTSEYSWYKGEFKKTKFERVKEIKKLKNVSTNWFSFDLGYANFQDKSPQLLYTQIVQLPNFVTPDNLKLINGKSSNFNLWIVQQKVSLYKNKLNLKYGVGFEMFNFRLEQPVSFRNDLPNKMILDNVSFSKNKLFAKYLTVPFQLNFKSDPKSNKSFYMSAGMSAGYLVDARNKQKSSERGKQKFDGNFNLNNWRFATIGELGIGGIRLYGSYGLTNLFEKGFSRIEFHPYTIGLRFSNF